MRVLLIWPPSIPTYFNPGHHLPLWEVSAYLRTARPDIEVATCDAGTLNHTWKDIAALLLRRFDLVCVMNEYDNVDGCRRLLQYLKAVSPDTKTLTFGRVSGVVPKFFERYGFDCIAASGDFEIAILRFIEYLERHGRDPQIPGLFVRLCSDDWCHGPAGEFLQPEDWAFADPLELPVIAYRNMSANPDNRFAPLPGLRELTVPIARGCPINCDFCLVPKYQGIRERRRPVEAVLAYIATAMATRKFDYVSMYAPTFTLNRSWTLMFCRGIQPQDLTWKCCTTVRHLDNETLKAMAESGCIRISVGLETLDVKAQQLLPNAKHCCEGQFLDLAVTCRQLGIELNCFAIIGLPGQSIEGLRRTIDVVRSAGAKVRLTAYSPYHLLSDQIEEEEMLRVYTRHLLPNDILSGQFSPEELYAIEFSPEQ